MLEKTPKEQCYSAQRLSEALLDIGGIGKLSVGLHMYTRRSCSTTVDIEPWFLPPNGDAHVCMSYNTAEKLWKICQDCSVQHFGTT